jgi:hypothetical protein
LKLFRSKDVKDLQPLNIPSMSVTESVIKYLIPVMELSFSIALNQQRVEVGRASTNVVSNTTRVTLNLFSRHLGTLSCAFTK